MNIVRRFFHFIAHKLRWNFVTCDVFGKWPEEKAWVGIKCQGCGMVRHIDDDKWFMIEERKQ